ncbi:transmembrane protease serine 9 [Gracilaria domingensis]|nr:transmembrane protease serine 9 [Gracilaria domingensis]
MRLSRFLQLLALLAVVTAAQKAVFASADAADGDDVLIVTSDRSSDDDGSRTPLSRLAASGDDRPPRQVALQFLGKPSDLPDEDDEEDDDNDEPISLIVGGKRVPSKLRKHLARVIAVDSFGSLVTCTGSVIARKYILSAAHCFVGFEIDIAASYVLVAEKSTKTKFFRSPRNKIFMKNVFVHRKYRDDGTYANDVALVELEEKIDDRFYSAIKLEKPPKESGTRIQAAGYGVRGSEKSEPKRVRRAKVLFQRWSVCDDHLGFQGATNRRKEICYTSLGFPKRGRTGTCFGDSGGPIVQRVDGKYEQVGITSSFYGDKCESAGAVMIAMRVRSYRRMIRRKVRKNRNRGWRRLR